MSPSNRSQIEPFRAMEGVARANRMIAEGRDIIMMCVGQPANPAPKAAREAARTAIDAGRIGYTNAGGIQPLRQRIATHYQDRYGVSVDPARVFVTTGSSAGFTLAFLSAFDPSARVAIPSPGYPAYRNILKTLSLEAVELSATEETRWVVDHSQLESEHTKKPIDGILIANPNNPNGTMMQPAAFRSLVQTCEGLGITFISDEIYHGLTYTQPEVCALEFSPHTWVINSFSKYFCMTGWRVGWMIVPEAMISSIDCLQQNVFICAPEVSQIAALAAFEGIDEMERVKAGYEKNRSLMLKRLQAIGIDTVQPIDGAFYAYADIKKFGLGSECLCQRLLDEASIAVTSGTDFDPSRGADWVRFSFAGASEEIVQGLDRLDAWIARQNY